jgi:hypothetical protein
VLDFAIPGLSIAVPPDWTYGFDPRAPVLVLTSPLPEGHSAPHNAFWYYLLDSGMARLNLINTEFAGAAEPDLSALLLRRFGPCPGGSWGGCTIYPEEQPEVLKGPTPLEVNGMPAAKAVLASQDMHSGQPFIAHVYAIYGGDRIVYASTALTDETDESYLPVIEEMVSTLGVGTPPSLKEMPQGFTTFGEITPGSVVTGTFATSPPDQIVRHGWTFNAEAGERYEVRVTTPEPGPDVAVNIVNAEGKSAIGGEYDTGGSGQTEYVLFMPRADGKYSIVVRSFFADTGPYEIDLKQLD